MRTTVTSPIGLLCKAQVRCGTTAPVKALSAELGTDALAVLFLFVTPQADFRAVVAEAEKLYPDTDVVACTTAGEIGALGYDEGLIVAVGFPRAEFASTSLAISDLDEFQPELEMDRVAQERVALQERSPEMENGFAFLIVDGLSLREDTLTTTISPALRNMPLFGASAGDGTDFQTTMVSLNGQIMTNGAVLNLIRSVHETEVFSLDHLVPTETQMVVTDADPERRIVKSINAEPAAREYARLVGKDPDQLDRFIFASHPVVVRIGGDHHVRAIQQVNEAGELVFFSAIDEGMVLTIAEPANMATHLRDQMERLAQRASFSDIIACDCILRRIEAEQMQMTRELSDVMSRYNVTGFSTYGEQIGPLHVNQTMTGVAFYRKDAS
ncbi:FIST N-terminal domain-containing protein [Cognatiyoonia sp. IB215182]|uniref:FIST N-terminal domain-containing protein n=1 Tax=Cognatiyoonia sp. IB215182 TaxID=3097353 RepID=UPI002A0B934F|nr:FIST N-terminal domain-containing protein [Cognatiyoonia sp. IB215182]MDX8351954.1 FIST N-terminal domain-containing protein [Cognatiyoonia sp. IB215182]